MLLSMWDVVEQGSWRLVFLCFDKNCEPCWHHIASHLSPTTVVQLCGLSYIMCIACRTKGSKFRMPATCFDGDHERPKQDIRKDSRTSVVQYLGFVSTGRKDVGMPRLL